MEYRRLGRAGLMVSTITPDAGFNLLDTSDQYSLGKSEEMVGETIRNKHNDVLIATKGRFPMGAGRMTRVSRGII